MPDASTMTPPSLNFPPVSPLQSRPGLSPSRIPRPVAPHLTPAQDKFVAKMVPVLPKAPRAVAPTHTVHINIGRIEVPRSLPAVRHMSTQTDDTQVAELKQEARDKLEAEAVEAGRLKNRAKRFAKKWVWPTLKFLGRAAVFIMGRVGVGFRGN